MAYGFGRGFISSIAAETAHPFDHHITIKKIELVAIGAAADVSITLDGVAHVYDLETDGQTHEIDFNPPQQFNTVVLGAPTVGMRTTIYHG